MQPGPVMLKVNPMTFAKRLKDARVAAQLTQRQVADACGISDRTVSAWETGTAEGVLAEHLFCVADVLRVDARWLATGEKPSSDPAVIEVIAALPSLPEPQKQAVRALVRSLKG